MIIFGNKAKAFLSSNVPLSETAYNSVTPYSYGQTARDGNYIYSSLVAGTNTNLNRRPSTSPLHWRKSFPANQFAMLDGVSSSQTALMNEIIVSVANDNVGAIALFGLDANSVRVRILNGTTVLHQDTRQLIDSSDIVDEVSYWFGEFNYAEMAYFSVPYYATGQIEVIISKVGNIAKCGQLCVGIPEFIGDAKWGISSTIDRFSRDTVDEFGFSQTEEAYAGTNDTFSLSIVSEKFPNTRRKLLKYTGVPLVFVADEKANSRFENLISYGTLESVRLTLSTPVMSEIEITKKGLK